MTNIVMLGKNRLSLTRQSIESLYASTPGDNWTLTYVDDGSDDFRVLRYLRSITRKNFMLLEVSAGSSHVLSQLKNIGAYASEMRWGRGNWLYFSDNDVWFSPGWMPLLIEAATITEDDGFRLWGGQIHPFHESIRTQVNGMTDPVDKPDRFQVDEYEILDGPSWLMRWGIWDLCGPLDRTTAPGACQSEEYGFCQRLLRAGIIKTERESSGLEVTVFEGARIGVINPHVVVHTGLTQSNGALAPGAAERRAMIPAGVFAE